MKNIRLLFFMILCLVLTSCKAPNPTQKSEKADDVTIIKMSVLEYSYFVPIVRSFNQDCSDIQVELSVYGDRSYESIDQYHAQMATALMSGSADDIMEISGELYYKYLPQDYFYDINNFFEQDPTVSRSDLYENVLEVFEKNGQLKALPNGYTFMYIGINSKFSSIAEETYRNKKTIHYQEMIDIYSAMDESIRAEYKICPTNNLYRICSMFYLPVDFDNKKAYFQTPEYIALLKTVKEYTSADDDFYERAPMRSVNEDTHNEEYVFSLKWDTADEEFLPYDKGYTYIVPSTGSEIGPVRKFENYLPFADNEGRVFIETAGEVIAVNAYSDKKEAVWKFIKYCLYEYPNKGFYSYRNNIVKEINEKRIADVLEEHLIKINNGKSLTEEQRQDIENTYNFLMENLSLPATYYTPGAIIDTQSILLQYANDQLTAEQTAEQLQNKFELYFAE